MEEEGRWLALYLTSDGPEGMWGMCPCQTSQLFVRCTENVLSHIVTRCMKLHLNGCAYAEMLLLQALKYGPSMPTYVMQYMESHDRET